MGGKGIGKIANIGDKRMIKKNSLLLVTVCWLLVTGLIGCGYTTHSMISSKFKTIHIIPFVNKIDIIQEDNVGNKYKVYKPLLETDITKAVNNKYIFDGNLKSVKKESADLILKGELVEFRRDPLRYNDNDDVAEYRLNLVVNISLWDNKEDKLVWEEKGFTGSTSYFTEGQFVKSETIAINDTINDLARRVVERTVQQW